MNRHFKRWTSFVLAFCMMVSVALPAGAASVAASDTVKKTITGAVAEAGYESRGSVTVVDAKTSGSAVTAQLSLSGAKDGQSVVAAVQAVDAAGEALSGHGLRYLLADRQGDTAAVTIQEPGCRYFAVLPVQGILEQGWVTDLKTTSQQTAKGYDITLSAQLTMSDDLATKAAFARGMQKLEDMRFTCRVESPLLLGMTSVDMSRVVFTDPNGIYTLVGAAVVNGGVEITYKINETVNDSWVYLTTAKVKEQLQTTVSMSCTQTVSPAVIQQGVNREGKIYTYGQVTIANGDGSQVIPGLDTKAIVVPAKLTEVTAAKLLDLTQVTLSAQWSGAGKARVTVNNQSDLALGGWLLCVAYNEDGKMLGYNGTYADVYGEDSEEFTIALPAVSESIGMAKVMFLDVANGCVPMCEAVQVQ